jgi:uncharacterized protein YdeI (YjbR/CyaY-like superfamily)
MKRFKTVDEFIAGIEKFRDELIKLRKILNSTELEETIKWGSLCYTSGGKNVVGIGAFQSYFGLWFFQGALIDDKNNLLINAGEGKTKALRQWRITSSKEIKPRVIKSYVKAAIQIVVDGAEIKPDRNKPLEIPSELFTALSKHRSAKISFSKMTKGKQREYTDYVSSAKRAETKQSRIEKILPMIVEGIGLNDKYRNC